MDALLGILQNFVVW